MSITSPFPYTIKDDPGSVTCVFKLWFGKKYYIYKALKLHQLLENLSAQIHRERQNVKENSILFEVIKYINKSRVTMMEVEVLKATDEYVDLLMTEYEALQEAKDDDNCLNLKFVNHEHFPNWMPQVAINEFTKRLQGEKMPDKHRNLRRFLNANLPDTKDKADVVEKFFKYVTKHFK
jgi:hypothetical protein